VFSLGNKAVRGLKTHRYHRNEVILLPRFKEHPKGLPYVLVPMIVGPHYRVAGYRVRHCGHPTALWPYYGQTPRTDLLTAPNGRGFQTLNQAQAAVEAEALHPCAE
jgi:hypothetical protein